MAARHNGLARLGAAATGTALAVVLTGCGAAGSAPTPATAAAPAAASAACGRAAAPGTSTISVTAGGVVRTVIVHVPHAGTGVRLPLVVNLHGSGSTAAGQEVFSGMDATADADGFIVAYPQARIASGTGFDWNVPGQPLVGGGTVPAGAPDDVAFLTGLPAQLESRYCIDSRRVDVTGMSGGGRMASQLACDAPTVFAAAAPVAGLRFPGPCTTGRAVPIIAFHGTADPIDPFDGNGQGYWTYSVPSAAQQWAQAEGCKPGAPTGGAGYQVTTYSGCRDGSEVQLDAVVGEGHEWPGGPTMPRSLTRVLGAQSDAVHADASMWAFFAAHPLG